MPSEFYKNQYLFQKIYQKNEFMIITNKTEQSIVQRTLNLSQGPTFSSLNTAIKLIL